jgi:hypothetical protein
VDNYLAIKNIISRAKVESKTTDDFISCLEEIDDMVLGEESLYKKAKRELTTHFEIALQKYYQIRLENMGYEHSGFFGKDIPNKEHWKTDMAAALINASKNNKGFERGYVYTSSELRSIFGESKQDAFREALGHLSISQKEAREKNLFNDLDVSLEGIYKFSDMVFPNDFKKEE